MKQTKVFTFSYPELSQRGDRVEKVVARDILEFVKYGYPETLATTVKEKTEAFKAILPDMFYEGQKTLATSAKDEYKERLISMLDEIGFKAKLALGAKSKEYATFRFSGITRLNDKELVQYSKHVCKTAEFFKDVLATRNITEEDIKNTMAVTNNLDDAIDAQTEAIALREQMSVERLKKGNELYELILELCEVGKRIWDGRNEAFYHDYVLYGSNKSNDNGNDEAPKEEPNTEEPVAEE